MTTLTRRARTGEFRRAVSVYLAPDLFVRLETERRRSGLNRSDLIALLVEDGLGRLQTPAPRYTKE